MAFQPGWEHADPGADGNCVTNVRFPRGWDQDRGRQATWPRYNNVPRVDSQVAGMAHGEKARAGKTGPLTPGLLALTMTAIPYSAAEAIALEL